MGFASVSPVSSVVESSGRHRRVLINARSEQIIAKETEVAVTRRARRRGLLGRAALAQDSALVLAPCVMIHTAFMRFAIDVIFVDRAGRVVRLVRDLRPWRVAAAFGASVTIECAAGAIDSRDVAVGDQLYLEASGEGDSAVAGLERAVS